MAINKRNQIKVIDVSETPLKPNVVRAGKQVPYVLLDKTAVERILPPDVIITTKLAPRVVFQSIPPGTKVARGASIDVTLAPRSVIPAGVFAGVHNNFRERTVENVVTTFLENKTVFDAVVDFDEADDLPPATRKAIQTELSRNEITIDEDDPGQSFAAAFRTLKGAAAFK